MQTKKIKLNMSSFDLAKGFAMILVILGHSLNSGRYNIGALTLLTPFLSFLLLSSYFLPMFFVLSGHGFKEKTPLQMLKKTFTDLIVPYLWVWLSIVAVYPISYYLQTKSWQEAITIAIRYTFAFLFGIPEYGKTFLGYEILSVFAMWFFLTLFVAFNVLNLILKIKNHVGQIFVVLLCFVVGYKLLILECNYYCFPQGLLAVGYCYTGYMIKKYKLLQRGLHCIWVYLILIPIMLAALRWGYFDMCLGHFNYGIWDCVVAGPIGVGLVFLLVYLGQFEWKALDWIKQIGVYTYWIICIHTVEYGLIQWSALPAAIPNQQLALVLELLLKVIILTAGCYLLKKLSYFKYRRRMIKNGQ